MQDSPPCDLYSRLATKISEVYGGRGGHRGCSTFEVVGCSWKLQLGDDNLYEILA